jgi:hypothetical protein
MKDDQEDCIPATLIEIGGSTERGTFEVRFARGWEGALRGEDDDILLRIGEEEFFARIEAYADGPPWMLNHGAAGMWAKLRQTQDRWTLEAIATPERAEALWGEMLTGSEDPGVLNHAFGEILSSIANQSIGQRQAMGRDDWAAALLADPTYPTLSRGFDMVLMDADTLMVKMLNHIERYPIFQCDNCGRWAQADMNSVEYEDPDNDLMTCDECMQHPSPPPLVQPQGVGEA